jgi:TatD DNase family protein
MVKGIFDTHCHLFDDDFSIVKKLIDEASLVGVSQILNVGYDLETSKKALLYSYKHQNLYASIGIHPTKITQFIKKEVTILYLEKLIKKNLFSFEDNNRLLAIGEIGLDNFHKSNEYSFYDQKYWFIKQLELAKKYDLPVLLHIREENRKDNDSYPIFDQVYTILKNMFINKGILHCFTADLKTAMKFIDLGFLISFAGNVTFENAINLQDVVKNINLEKILVETDSPYLSPSPERGLENKPKNIIFTLKKIAQLKKISLTELIKFTSNNSLNLFNLNNLKIRKK